jgi:hypothetical protein
LNFPPQAIAAKVPFVILSTDVRPEIVDLARPLRSSGFRSRTEASDIDDWSIARTERVNALVMGPAALTDALIAREFPSLLPAAVWSASEGFEVSATLESVLVRNVQDLTSDQQDRLMAWMDRHPTIQIISTATCALHPWVVDGRFRSALYYRLNIFYFPL